MRCFKVFSFNKLLENDEIDIKQLFNVLYHKIGIRAKAREYAQQLVQPQYKRYQLQYVHGLYSLAFYDQMDGKEESAIEQYENLIQSYPKSKMAPEALREIARMHYFKGDLDGAIEVTQRIIDNYPNSDIGKQAPNQLKELMDIKVHSIKVVSKPSNTPVAKASTDIKEVSSVPTNLCGPIALQYVLNHYGIKADIPELAELSNYHQDGTSFAGLAHAAQTKGMHAFGLKADFITLSSLIKI